MKKNQNGFMLVETLIVSVFILSTLIFLFVQFQKIESGYSLSYKYNPTDKLYAVYNIRDYILKNGYENIANALDNSIDNYLNISTCPATYLSNTEYCSSLVSYLDVKTIFFTKENTSDLVADFKNIGTINQDMKSFIKYIKYDDEATKNRLIVEFNDETYASLKIFK